MKRRENQNIEWKKDWKDEYLKWVCGFANAQGGVLYIGKDDNGNIVGLANAPKLLEDIPNKIRDILGIIVDVNLCSENNTDYLKIIVEPYPYPISYKGEYHYRTGSTKQELKGAALDKFLLKKQGLHWDGVPAPGFLIKDLSPSAIAKFRQRAAKSKRLSAEILSETDENLIKKLRLFSNSYLKRAAVLLFHEDPEVLVGGAYIKIGFFRTNADLLYQDEIHGDLFTQVEKAMDLLLTKYLKAGISYDGLQRLEEFPLPELALREALINAIAHKNYASAIPIQISVYDDKLMIWNSGQLPVDWSIDELFSKHESQPYNPDIANTFFRAAYMESWGRGFEKIVEACEEMKSPLPKVRYEHTGLWIEFPFRKLLKTQPKGSPKGSPKSSPKTADLIIDMIRNNCDITTMVIANELGISKRAVIKHTNKLQENGKLKHIGPKNGGHWEVVENDK